MLCLFTDFGSQDIYVGQMKARIVAASPGLQVVDLLHDASPYAIESAAHLLAALAVTLPANTVTVAVVDPGVGSLRRASALYADNKWYIGPDNGLMSLVAMRASEASWFEVLWRPTNLSASFHGRDLFAPFAVMLHDAPTEAARYMRPIEDVHLLADIALYQCIHVDHYGNLISGIPAHELGLEALLRVGNAQVAHARVFSDVPVGQAFWYANSLGLVEVAVNQGSASATLGVSYGAVFSRADKLR